MNNTVQKIIKNDGEVERFVAEVLKSASVLKKKRVVEKLLHLANPKVLFLKNLPLNAKVLDLGAGNGSLVNFKRYLEPKRPDLEFYAFSLEKGEGFKSYAGFEIADWNIKRPDFGGIKFDAICTSHFIEHVNDSDEVVPWCMSRLTDDGRLYLEWPSEYALEVPSATILNKLGLMVQIGNFFDDVTHQRIPDRKIIIKTLEDLGAVIEQQGYIRFPFLETELFALFKNDPFSYPLQAAFWSRTRWAQYLIASKTI